MPLTPPPPVRVAHLHCLYCGGERKGDDSACRKCLADAPSARCRACQAEVFAPNTKCICGTRCDAWGPAEPEALGCPRCHGRLTRVSVDDADAMHLVRCAGCMGCFARTRDFSGLVARELAGQGVDLGPFLAPPGGDVRVDRLAETSCPYCRGGMERVRFAQKAGLLVDVCPKHGLWVDAGVLPEVLAFVRHRAKGEATFDEADRQDQQRWDHVLAERNVEEQEVSARLRRAEERLASNGNRSVAFATVVGGPIIGFLVALRQRLGRRSR